MRMLKVLSLLFCSLSLLSCQEEAPSYMESLMSDQAKWWYGGEIRCSSLESLQDVYRLFALGNEEEFAIPLAIASPAAFSEYRFRAWVADDGWDHSLDADIDDSQIYYRAKIFDSVTYVEQYSIEVFSYPLEGDVDLSSPLEFEWVESGVYSSLGDYSLYRYTQGDVVCFEAVIYYEDGYDPYYLARTFTSRWILLGQ